jgi:hypothetical protein
VPDKPQQFAWCYVHGDGVVRTGHKALLRFDSSHAAFLFLYNAGWRGGMYYPAHGTLFTKRITTCMTS